MIDEKITAEFLNQHFTGNMISHLGIKFTHADAETLVAEMPVDERTQQPFGFLHGGASVVLAESLGSVGSNLLVDQKKQTCVGLEINANHIKGVQCGKVTGTAKAVHIGKRTHIWQIDITNEQKELVCTSRLTVAVLDLKKN